MSADVEFKECPAFIDDKLLEEIGQGLESCGGDDLQKLFDSVDIEASINTEDLIGNLPDDLEIPIFDGGVQDVFREDIWKDGSDGSDSGIDCLSIKHEPMSPASSHCSDFSDSQNSQTALMDYSPTLTQFSQHSETTPDLFSQFDLGSLGDGTDPLYFTTSDDNDQFIKTELPETPPLTPHPDQLTETVAREQQGVAIATTGCSIAENVNCVNNTTNSTLNDSGSGGSNVARAITFVTNNGVKKNTVTLNTVNKSGNGGPIKVVLPVSHTQNGRIKKIVNTSKVKIQPRPVTTGQSATGQSGAAVKTTKIQGNTLPQGKPLVLTPEEFAKLTAQGVLKLESTHSTSASSSTPTTIPVSTATRATLPTSSRPAATTTTMSTTNNSLSNQGTAIATPALCQKSPSAVSNKSMSLPMGFPVTQGCGPVTDLDLKAWKRQQRMIKNRESACLSRRRKKEYLTTVEERLQAFTHQNEKLKSENNHLKRRLEQLAKENESLRSRVPGVSTVKKAAISLLAVALFFTLNLSPLTSILHPGSQSVPALGALPSSSAHHGRHLMSIQDGDDPSSTAAFMDTKATYNINDIEATVNAWRKSMEFTGLSSNGGGGLGGGGSNNKREGSLAAEDMLLMKEVEKLKLSLSTVCPLYYNSTESKRLMSEITGWFLGQKEELRRRELDSQHKGRQRQARNTKKVSRPRKVASRELDSYSAEYSDPSGSANELQVFTGPDNRYERFMDAIHRRNDTFYVVSFRRDQLLLPATATNNSMGRPRMSLVMPAMGLNDTMQPSPGNIAMMQIDCEVMATNVLHIQKNSVPEKMMDNGTFFMPPSPAQAEVPPGGNNGQTTHGKGHLPRDRGHP